MTPALTLAFITMAGNDKEVTYLVAIYYIQDSLLYAIYNSCLNLFYYYELSRSVNLEKIISHLGVKKHCLFDKHKF